MSDASVPLRNSSGLRPASVVGRVIAVLRVNPQDSRLNAALIESEHRVRALKERNLSPDASTTPIGRLVLRLEDLLRLASEAAVRRDRFVAYNLLQQIDRELVEAMDDAERAVVARSYLAESKEKLGGWRSEAGTTIGELAAGTPTSVPALQALMKHVHAASQNQQHKLELLDRQLQTVMVMTLVIVVATVALALMPGVHLLDGMAKDAPLDRAVLTGALLGLFGGLVSMISRSAEGRLDRKIPDLRHAWFVAVGRPFVGAAVAIPIVLLLKSGVLGDDALPPSLLFGACFLGGFSERWFIDQVEARVGKATAKSTAAPATGPLPGALPGAPPVAPESER